MPNQLRTKNLILQALQTGRYILIAEDDEDDQLLIRSAFKETGEGIELLFVQNGIELLDHFRAYEEGRISTLPVLLVVDLNMPKKNGREAIAELRHKPYFIDFPSVVFSTTGNDLERQRCQELGFESYFVKPTNFTALIAVANRFIQLARSRVNGRPGR